jgi:signal transduction histidine kinase
MFAGIALMASLYHIFLYFHSVRERLYIIHAAAAFLLAVRFCAFPGGFAELVTPEAFLTAVSVTANISLFFFYVFGDWFNHEILRLKWGGYAGLAVYFLGIRLPMLIAFLTGSPKAMTVTFMLSGIPQINLLIRGFASERCRRDPYAAAYLFLCVLFLFFPVMYAIATRNGIFAFSVPFLTHWLLMQAVMLSHSYGEAKQRERELAAEKSMTENLARIKNEFFGNISHEMQTPLTVIATDIELAEINIGAANYDEARFLMREALTETMQLGGLVADTLSFARGQETAKPMSRIDFGSVIEVTLTASQAVIAARGNELTREIEKLSLIWGNADMLSGALNNLLANANRYARGLITVTWIMKNEKPCLTVRDNGFGFAPGILPQALKRGVTDGGGAGLGLAIVKSVMDVHGGEVIVESEEGTGAAVTLAFPERAEGANG